MGFGRRSVIELFGGGLLLLGPGCTEDSPDHRRGLELTMYGIDQPPEDVRVGELGDETPEHSLLHTFCDLLVKHRREIPQEYSRGDAVSIARGTTNRFTSGGPYLLYKSTQFGAEHEATLTTLQELPRSEPESGPSTVLYLHFRDRYIRLEYRVLYSTPS